jgi:hypothetical protein
MIKSCDVVFDLLRLLYPHDIDSLLCAFEVEFKLTVLFRELELLICWEHHSLLAALVFKPESVSQIQGVRLIPSRGIQSLTILSTYSPCTLRLLQMCSWTRHSLGRFEISTTHLGKEPVRRIL